MQAIFGHGLVNATAASTRIGNYIYANGGDLDDGIDLIASIASEVNNTVENIGARRLHTIIERILDDISFTATDRAGEKIIINKDYISKNLDNLIKDTDLSKFIL